jgi:hypothetical protein
VRDLGPREICCLAPLLVLILWIGLYPQFFLDRMTPTLEKLTKPAMQAADQLESERKNIHDSITSNNSSVEHSAFIVQHFSP